MEWIKKFRSCKNSIYTKKLYLERVSDLEERILSGEDISDMEEDKPKKRKRGRLRKEKEVVEDAVLVEDEDTPMNGLLMPLN